MLLKNKKYGIILSLASVVFSLIIIEIYVRCFSNMSDLLKTYKEDIYVGYRPNIKGIFYDPLGKNIPIRINNYGFRGKDWEKAKSHRNRIVFLGDSFTAGFQVHEPGIFTSLTEKLLNNRGYDVEVFNAGVEGTGTGQQYIYYNKIISDFNPDVLILFMCINDLYDNSYKLNWKSYVPKWSIQNEKLFFHPPDKKMLHLMNLCRYVRSMEYLFKVYHLFKVHSVYKANSKGLVMNDEFYSPHEKPEYMETYKILEFIIGRMNKECKKTGTKLILMFFSNDYIYLEKNGVDSNLDYDYPEKKINEISKRINVPYIDLTEHIKEEYKKQKNWDWLCFINDGHFNRAGHKWIAGIISGKISYYLKHGL